MRLKLHLQLLDPRQHTLPINYAYILRAWVYKLLHSGNSDFADWLHQKGYRAAGKSFKLFTFSPIVIPRGKYRIVERIRIPNPSKEQKAIATGLRIFSRTVSFTFSIKTDEIAEPLISGIFKNQDGLLGDDISQVPFQVASVEILPAPPFKETMSFRCTSPVCVSQKGMHQGREQAQYLPPDDPDFAPILFDNLRKKVLAAQYPKQAVAASVEAPLPFRDAPCSLRLLNRPRSKVIYERKKDTPRPIGVKGYLFDFELTAPVSLVESGYYAGFGGKNPGGFGFVEIMASKR